MNPEMNDEQFPGEAKAYAFTITSRISIFIAE
jgi:hypothetical protein